MTGGWAATNTLRDTLDDYHGYVASDPTQPDEPAYAALALVETALDAADELVGLRMDDFDRTYRALAAALRAVREGA